MMIIIISNLREQLKTDCHQHKVTLESESKHQFTGAGLVFFFCLRGDAGSEKSSSARLSFCCVITATLNNVPSPLTNKTPMSPLFLFLTNLRLAGSRCVVVVRRSGCNSRNSRSVYAQRQMEREDHEVRRA